MAEPDQPQSPDPGRKRIPGEVLAFVLSLIWLVLLAVAFRVLGQQGMQLSDTLGLVVVALAVFLPVALIWLAVLVLRAAREMRDESARLQASVEGMRRGWIRDQQAAGLALKPTVEQKLDAIAAAQRQTEDRIAMFTTRRDPARRGAAAPAPGPAAAGDGSQPVLALENPLPVTEPLDAADFIRALNFPENEGDEAGFAALRRALKDHGTAELIRAAQDVLTTLAQEGIYMDDLRPDRARPEVWRAFAVGARGREVAALGGVRDRSCLALTYARMRSDPGFREAAHRFLRAYDRRFQEFESAASDGDIARLAETRSARAFMLLGRVTGIFG
ncbi:MAG: hypothetical protein H6899_11165 [Rhodobacter sp.]|nr:hypothetical protein [Rhodobacter sp.]